MHNFISSSLCSLGEEVSKNIQFNMYIFCYLLCNLKVLSHGKLKIFKALLSLDLYLIFIFIESIGPLEPS